MNKSAVIFEAGSCVMRNLPALKFSRIWWYLMSIYLDYFVGTLLLAMHLAASLSISKGKDLMSDESSKLTGCQSH